MFTYPMMNRPTFYGSTGSIVLNKPIVGIAGKGSHPVFGSDRGGGLPPERT